MNIRKSLVIRETIHGEGGRDCARPINRVAGVGIVVNPFAGKFVQDLESLFDLGEALGHHLMALMLAQLAGPAVSYGKAAIVGVGGDLEHGHALIHPQLGKAMREPIGGGEALIPSAVKVGAAGSSIDVPLGHKDDAWSFDHFDAMTVVAADAPRPGEIMMVIVICDGGRPLPRVGKARASV